MASEIMHPAVRVGFMIGMEKEIRRLERTKEFTNMSGYIQNKKMTNANRACNLSRRTSFDQREVSTTFEMLIVKSKSVAGSINLTGHARMAQTEIKESLVFHAAPWLIRCGLAYGIEFAARQALKGWKCTFETFRVVRDDSLIFTSCRDGNLEAVRELFVRGQASAFDTDSWGWTPLHVSHAKLT